MKLILATPTKLVLPSEWIDSSVEAELRKELRFKDMKVEFNIRKWREHQRNPKGSWFVHQFGEEALELKIAELQKELIKSALFKKDGQLYTYSGLAHRISNQYGCEVVRQFEMPEPKHIATLKESHKARWYQKQSADLLVAVGHGAVELATGLGKSFIIADLIYRLGLPAVVVAPTLSIANQLYSDCKAMFGTKYVGMFFGGKKQADKKIVIAVSKSLTLVKPNTPEHAMLSNKSVLIGDESHLLPADTLAAVVLKLFKNIPYRFFLSGTQTRSDGLQIVLEGITGPIVMQMNVKEGVDSGFLARPKFVQVKVRSDLPEARKSDPIKVNRTHLHRNPNVYAHAGKLIKWALSQKRRPLVLLEEVGQFAYLFPHIKQIEKVGFAHGGVAKELRKEIPEKFHKSNSMQLVAEFDAGELDLLVGTQCIGVGTDIKTANVIIDIVGLASEVRLRQNVGRGTRKSGDKQDFMYVDYDIFNIEILSKQAAKRFGIFENIYGPVKVL